MAITNFTASDKLLHVPSVIKQATNRGWPADFFRFGKAEKPGVDFFNCSILERGTARALIVRRAQWDKRDAFGYNSVLAFSLDGLKPQMGYKVNLGYQFPQEHFEDPRAIVFNGRIFISACNFIRHRHGMTFPHQTISEVSGDWQLVRRYDPVYGKNGRDAGCNTGHEKNWAPFFHKGEPHFVYSSCPHEVIRMDFNFKTVEVFSSAWDSSVWSFGQIRGGSPPILVDGLYHTFFHSSLPHPIARRRYFLGCYAFDPHPPFAVRKITLDPLLTGSELDGGLPAKPPCVFCSGSLYDAGEWLIVFGVNDARCGHCHIPHADLVDEMIEL